MLMLSFTGGLLRIMETVVLARKASANIQLPYTPDLMPHSNNHPLLQDPQKNFS